jgi:transcriptional regulator with XRE-family HTH domain
MKNENTEKIREKVLELIESEFESDAAFERALGLAEKTVNNWRRGRSASFMKMLPLLSDKFGINVGTLMDIPLRRDCPELSDEELKLLHLFRRSRSLPQKMRIALRENLESTINLYIASYQEVKEKYNKKSRTEREKQ